MNSNRGNNLQLKEDLLAKETSLFQARSTVTELKKELDQAREEVPDDELSVLASHVALSRR